MTFVNMHKQAQVISSELKPMQVEGHWLQFQESQLQDNVRLEVLAWCWGGRPRMSALPATVLKNNN